MCTAQASTIRLTPNTQTANVGQTLQASVMAVGFVQGGAPSIGAYDFSISFDPAVLSFVGVTFGTGLDVLGLGSIQTVTLGAGSVELLEISLDASDDLNALQGDSFGLATLTLRALGTGTTPLNISQATISDAYGNALIPNFEASKVQVISNQPTSITPEPAGLFVGAMGFVVLAGWLSRNRVADTEIAT